jgi:hypothetical protein
MKKTLVFAALAFASIAAMAQSSESLGQATAAAYAPVNLQFGAGFGDGGGGGGHTRVTYKGAGQFTAPTGASVFGAVGNAGGCPALEGWSGGIFLGNASETTAIELPGCMGLLMSNLTSNVNPTDDGTITFKERTLLLPLCAFYQYRVAIQTMGYRYAGREFVCPIDDKTIPYEQRARIGVTQDYADSDVTDPVIRRRAKMQPVYR